jgi:hypothetical protein
MNKVASFLNKLNENFIVYHGSNEETPISAFKEITTSTNSYTFGQSEVTRHGIFFTDNPEYAKQYGPNVFKYNLAVKSAMPVTRDLLLDFSDSLDAFGPQRDVWIWARNLQYFWQAFDEEIGEVFVNWLKQKGIECAIFKEWLETDDEDGVSGTTYVVFDPSKIHPIK